MPRRAESRRSPESVETTARVSSKGQVVIPAEVRDAMGWRQGDTLAVERTTDGVLLRRVSSIGPALSVDDVSGMAKRLFKGPPLSLEQIDARTKAAFGEQWKKQHAKKQKS